MLELHDARPLENRVHLWQRAGMELLGTLSAGDIDSKDSEWVLRSCPYSVLWLLFMVGAY